MFLSSWSPRGALMTALNGAKYVENSEVSHSINCVQMLLFLN